MDIKKTKGAETSFNLYPVGWLPIKDKSFISATKKNALIQSTFHMFPNVLVYTLALPANLYRLPIQKNTYFSWRISIKGFVDIICYW